MDSQEIQTLIDYLCEDFSPEELDNTEEMVASLQYLLGVDATQAVSILDSLRKLHSLGSYNFN